MHDLIPITAFGQEDPRREVIGEMSLAERADIALASLAGFNGAACRAVLGLDLPGPGRAEWSDGLGAIWMGPGQWMVVGDGAADTDFAARVAADQPGAAVTEQTDGWVVLDLRSTKGPQQIGDLLERLVNLPPDVLAPGGATRTLLHHMSVVLARVGADHLRIIGARSSAEDLWHALASTLARSAAPSP